MPFIGTNHGICFSKLANQLGYSVCENHPVCRSTFNVLCYILYESDILRAGRQRPSPAVTLSRLEETNLYVAEHPVSQTSQNSGLAGETLLR